MREREITRKQKYLEQKKEQRERGGQSHLVVALFLGRGSSVGHCDAPELSDREELEKERDKERDDLKFESSVSGRNKKAVGFI